MGADALAGEVVMLAVRQTGAPLLIRLGRSLLDLEAAQLRRTLAVFLHAGAVGGFLLGSHLDALQLDLLRAGVVAAIDPVGADQHGVAAVERELVQHVPSRLAVLALDLHPPGVPAQGRSDLQLVDQQPGGFELLQHILIVRGHPVRPRSSLVQRGTAYPKNVPLRTHLRMTP